VRRGAKPLAVEPSARESGDRARRRETLGVDFAGVDIINDERGAPRLF
jgi:glutathione synthase/RimK-type ligase-like ATP-grasp enzyme